MSHKELQTLLGLRNHAGYQMLLALWVQKITNIESRRDVAASRGQESAWRYFAGMEKGSKEIVTALDEEIARLEAEGGEIAREPSEMISKLLKEARGEK